MTGISKDNVTILAILCVMLAVAALVLYRPQAQAMAELRKQIETEKNTTATYAARVAIVPDLRRQVEDMKSRYKDFDRRMPKQKELYGFLEEISKSIDKERLSNHLIEAGGTDKEESFYTMPITMRFQGNYLSLASFLKRIDTMERLTRVQKLHITADNQGAEPKINCELRLNIYFTES